MQGLQHIIKVANISGVISFKGFEVIPFSHDASLTTAKAQAHRNSTVGSEETLYTVKISYPSTLIPTIGTITIANLITAATTEIEDAFGADELTEHLNVSQGEATDGDAGVAG